MSPRPKGQRTQRDNPSVWDREETVVGNLFLIQDKSSKNSSIHLLSTLFSHLLTPSTIGCSESKRKEPYEHKDPLDAYFTQLNENNKFLRSAILAQQGKIICQTATGQPPFSLNPTQKKAFTFDNAGMAMGFNVEEESMMLKQRRMTFDFQLKPEEMIHAISILVITYKFYSKEV